MQSGSIGSSAVVAGVLLLLECGRPAAEDWPQYIRDEGLRILAAGHTERLNAPGASVSLATHEQRATN